MGAARAGVLAGLAVALLACSSHRPGGTNKASALAAGPTNTASQANSITSRSASAPSSPDGGALLQVGGAPAAVEDAPREPTFDEIAIVLFPDRATFSTVGTECPPSLSSDARVRCLFDQRYRGDSRAASLAHELFTVWRVIAGVEVAHTMDGGYRGMIRIEPAVPMTTDRKHLEWIVGAMRDFDAFFTDLIPHAEPSSVDDTATHASRSPPKRYRFKPITLRFMRSVAARTPSAYAHDWTVAWNLSGSLHTSPDAVRETLFHEIFHLNDYAHPPPGGEAWSFDALGSTFDAIVKKCGTSIPCLGPYTPNETIVRGGTYYSFQPGNGVREYAAELALRYYREQRAVLRSTGELPKRSPKVRSFKCGPPENARAWALMRDEFFGGRDVVPSCGS